MRHKTHVIVLFFLLFLVFTVLFSFLFIYEYLLFFVPGVSASPPTIQQFYGDVSYPNGSLANGILIEAKFDGTVITSSYSSEGKYGYGDLFIVENLNEGDIISFYLNSVSVKEYSFNNFGFTNLNLQLDNLCGDSFCGGDESCQNCPEDCGGCIVDDDKGDDSGGGSSGGGGGGGGIVNVPVSAPNSLLEEPDNKTADDSDVSESVSSSPITGNVVADEFLSNKLFIPVILGLIILLILIILEILSVRRHHLEELRKGQV